MSTSTEAKTPWWQSLERQFLTHLSRWSDKWVHIGLVLVFSAWIVVDVLLVGVTGGLAQTTYDNMVRGRVITAPTDPRIVIIDIDESALARMATEFGRWPWPRDTLASVLDYVEEQQPAAVVWDIIFSDVDRLNPGGDAAFDAAAKRSAHSHFGLVRLPKENDDKSELTQKNLPNLWVQTAPQESKELSTIALIPPVLPGVAVKPLGYNNGYVDRDGILRRYRYFERLDDGGMIQSLPMSVVQQVDPQAHTFWLERFLNKPQKIASDNATEDDVLINWRKKANSYPHVNFADVFALADGAKAKEEVPSFAGKIVIIGATAPSLHDIHPTPLSSAQAGVESLATGIDNALNKRAMREMPKWLGALIAIVMCIGLAFWSYRNSVSSLAAGMLGLPSVMLGISFLSLNTEHLFLDLHLSAALGLLFVALLRVWFTIQKRHWCSDMPPDHAPLAVWSWRAKEPWNDQQLQSLMRELQEHAFNCRIVLLDITPAGSNLVRWKPFAHLLALVGPEDELQASKFHLQKIAKSMQSEQGAILALAKSADNAKQKITRMALDGWAQLHPHE
ncbi:MAG: CHASE2 domain-containing protein [Betaproteobacteria bacterium]